RSILGSGGRLAKTTLVRRAPEVVAGEGGCSPGVGEASADVDSVSSSVRGHCREKETDASHGCSSGAAEEVPPEWFVSGGLFERDDRESDGSVRYSGSSDLSCIPGEPLLSCGGLG